ncbi:MAG: hypothetical protein QHC90_22810 [Shinella sp.]|nr:hypothetical protein [Shinella sp.]
MANFPLQPEERSGTGFPIGVIVSALLAIAGYLFLGGTLEQRQSNANIYLPETNPEQPQR